MSISPVGGSKSDGTSSRLLILLFICSHGAYRQPKRSTIQTIHRSHPTMDGLMDECRPVQTTSCDLFFAMNIRHFCKSQLTLSTYSYYSLPDFITTERSVDMFLPVTVVSVSTHLNFECMQFWLYHGDTVQKKKKVADHHRLRYSFNCYR